MFFKLLLLFIIIPILELAILIKIGTLIGTMNTVSLVILTAFLGAYMVKREGFNVLYRFQENVTKESLPTEELFDGAMILTAGAMLLTPGIITDTIGFLMVFPASREVLKEIIKRYIKQRLLQSQIF